MGLKNIFFKSKSEFSETVPITTDIHSHFLPGIDDGSKNVEDSMLLLTEMVALGYRKVITTPHIIQDYYPNTPEIIIEKLEIVKGAIEEAGLGIAIEAAAEYYLDEYFMEKVKISAPLLTFGENYLLFEMSFMSESPFLNDILFTLNTKGIKPVLAHAERYSFLVNNLEKIDDLIQRGCLIQLNINSLVGAYGRPSQKFAEKLIDAEMVHFLGTDCHHIGHLASIKKAQKTKYYQKALHLRLINHSI